VLRARSFAALPDDVKAKQSTIKNQR